jgi:hypothetical protein
VIVGITLVGKFIQIMIPWVAITCNVIRPYNVSEEYPAPVFTVEDRGSMLL